VSHGRADRRTNIYDSLFTKMLAIIQRVRAIATGYIGLRAHIPPNAIFKTFFFVFFPKYILFFFMTEQQKVIIS